MTDQKSNLPALVQPSREVARTDTDSWVGVFNEVIELARGIADTEFVPRGLRGSIPATTAAILYGREVGLPPMTALNSTHVIEGRPSIEAQAMRAMVLAAGHDIEVVDSSGAICVMRARRNGSERWSKEVTWSIDMARAAGLTDKKNWKNYPRRMLQARCTSELCELYFPDVIMGFRSIEEMTDVAEGEGEEPAQTTAVQRAPRKRAAAKTSTAQAPTAPSTPAADIPLPGEPGYEDPAKTSAGGSTVQGEGEDSPVDQDSGEATEGAAPVGDAASPDPEPSPAPDDSRSSVERPAASDSGSTAAPDEDQGASAGEAEDIHDAVIVEDPPDEQQPPAEPGPRRANRAQIRALFKVLERFYVAEGDRHRIVGGLLGRELTSFNDITADEVSPALDTLAMLKDRESLDALVLAAEQRRDQAEGGDS